MTYLTAIMHRIQFQPDAASESARETHSAPLDNPLGLGSPGKRKKWHPK